VCGYDKHVDICHVVDIKAHSDETLISDINAITNLVALCKNHHWEFDRDLMSPEDVKVVMNSVGGE
jgi:predicted restriction endonuclease